MSNLRIRIRNSELISTVAEEQPEPDCTRTFCMDDCEVDTVFKMVRSDAYTEKDSKPISNSRSPRKRNSDSVQIFNIPTSRKHSDRLETLIKLHWHEQLQLAAEEILAEKNEGYAAIAKKYEFDPKKDCEILNTKINILKKERKYLETKDKIEKIFKDNLLDETNKDKVAEKIEISLEELDREYKKFEESKSNNVKYEYDVLTSDNAIFTFTQEFLFLEILISERRKKSFDCLCYSCLMACLNVIALAELIEKEKPSSWEDETAHQKWWFEFHMRHSRKISDFYFPPCTNPNKLNLIQLSSEEETSGPPHKIRSTE